MGGVPGLTCHLPFLLIPGVLSHHLWLFRTNDFPGPNYEFELRKESSSEVAFVGGTADSASYSQDFVLDSGVNYEVYVKGCGFVGTVVDDADTCDGVTTCKVRRTDSHVFLLAKPFARTQEISLSFVEFQARFRV